MIIIDATHGKPDTMPRIHSNDRVLVVTGYKDAATVQVVADAIGTVVTSASIFANDDPRNEAFAMWTVYHNQWNTKEVFVARAGVYIDHSIGVTLYPFCHIWTNLDYQGDIMILWEQTLFGQGAIDQCRPYGNQAEAALYAGMLPDDLSRRWAKLVMP